jgi:hypothetical protein
VAVALVALLLPVTQASAVVVGPFTSGTEFPGNVANWSQGTAVAISGDLAVVGAAYADPGGKADAGQAYIYQRTPGGWSLAWTLTAPDAAAADEFGKSVSIDASQVLVGAPMHVVNAVAQAGAVYVFDRTASGWDAGDEVNLGTGPNGARAGDNFGASVCVDMTRAVVGVPGRRVGAALNSAGVLYVSQKTGDTWGSSVELTAGASAATGDNLGTSVWIDGDVVVGGAPFSDFGVESDAGAAFVFRNVWGGRQKLVAPTPAAGDHLGRSVTCAGSTIVVGAPDHTVYSLAGAGAVFTYQYGSGVWGAGTELNLGDEAFANTYFGQGVALDPTGNTLVVGVRADTGVAAASGTAQVYRLSSGAWNSWGQTLMASDGGTGDFFGNAVAVGDDPGAAAGRLFVVGAAFHDHLASTHSGAAYFFETADPVPPTTTSNAAGPYTGSASITLTPVDTGGSVVAGVAFTSWSLTGPETKSGTGTTVSVTTPGTYHLEFWSGDNAGNVESPHKTVDFVVNGATWITLKSNATSARIGGVPILSGAVSHAGLVGTNIMVMVKKPGKAYYSYSSWRTVYSRYGVPSWQYKYFFKKGMTKGVYTFFAIVPASTGYTYSRTPNAVSIRLR